MLTLLLKAIQNLTRLGTIKSVQQAYQLAKRELGDQFNAAKKQIDDAFNQGKKEQTLDKRTKDIKKTEESGIKSLDEGKFVDDKGEFTEKAKDIFKEGIEGLEKGKGSTKLPKVVDEAIEIKPVVDRLSRAIDDVKKQTEKLGTPIDDDDAMRQKSLIENALRSLRDKRMYEMGSGLEGDVRTALRSFVKKELDEGRLEIPDAYERKMIAETRQGGVDPIDVFRKAYGEDALIAVDDIFEQYGNKLTGPTYKDIEENFRKLFKFNRGFYDMADLPVPKKEYGFEPGLQSVDSLEEELMKQYRQLDELDKFEPSTKRKPNANGGIMNSRIALDGGGSPLQRLRQSLVDDLMYQFPSMKEEDMQMIVKDINLDMSPEEAQASMSANFTKVFGSSGMFSKGGRVRAASGGLADILKV